MANPYWNSKLVSENGVLRPTMGRVLSVTNDPPPVRALVRLGLYAGDGTQTVDVEIPVIGSYIEIIDIDQPVMVLFMGDTNESGVVMGRVDWF